MSKYPMTYEEYEKKVIELLLEGETSDRQKKLLEDLEDLLNFDPDFIKNLYEHDCNRYDSDELGHERVFEDYVLKALPVNTLYMSL